MDPFCYSGFRRMAEHFIMQLLDPCFTEDNDSPEYCCASYAYGATRLAAAGTV
jgi:hypothetical protein